MCSESSWYCADAPFQPCFLRQQRRQQCGQLVAIPQPRFASPVREINLFLDRLPVKWSVRKAIDGEYVQIVLVEKCAECLYLTWACQSFSCLRGKPKSDAETLARGDMISDREDEALDVHAHLGPAFPRMDVGTIGQVGIARRVELHRATSR